MLQLNNISKSLSSTDGSTIDIIHNISMAIKPGEFVALVGPSGCGKTTLLRLIAGFGVPNGQPILFNSQPIKEPSPERGLVFQHFALFPWLTVADNIAFGLKIAGKDQAEVNTIVDKYLNITGLERFRNNYPKQLSGGMQQRVAIARTLASNPKIILMDEPFGALDAHTRSHMQEFLATLWENEHKTVVFVTHDIEEAIFLSDRVFLLSPRPARIVQEFAIPFARPRQHDLKFSSDFFELKKEITKKFE